LKDNDDDCDLDPELSVTDLLVDEGKAAQDGSDQRVTVKIIQEQGRAIRAGSVVPDLTPAHYQPPTRPPVPKFPDNKRPHEGQQEGFAQPKRRRLGQIEEEDRENVIDSIERDGERGFSHFELPGAHFLAALNNETHTHGVRPKIESPELAMPWTNTEPATRDELELLPEAPTNLHFRTSRTNLHTSVPQRTRDIEIRESSQLPPQNRLRHTISAADRAQNLIADRFQRQNPHSHAPITPPYTANAVRTPGDHAVSMLNGMKSASPVQRLSNSSSASRFRRLGTNGKDLYDYPESDIDDTQMSPRSRAQRSNIPPKQITPRLVQSPHSRNGIESAASAATSNSTADVSRNGTEHSRSHARDHPRLSYVERGSPTSRPEQKAQNEVDIDAMDVSANEERGDNVASNVIEPIIPEKRPVEDRRSMMDIEKSPAPVGDETQVQNVDGTKRKVKKPSNGKSREKSTNKGSGSRSHSVASSAKESLRSGQSGTPHRDRQLDDGNRAVESHNQADTTDELDGPGEQLIQNLQQSSPARSQQTAVRVNVPARKSDSKKKRTTSKTKRQDDTDDEDVDRPPESVSEDNDTVPKSKTSKPAKSTLQTSHDQPATDLRCLTCWRKQNKCDRLRPKCTHCERNKRNCQIYDMTRATADEEIEARRADKQRGKSKPPAHTSGATTQKSGHEQGAAASSVQQLRKPKSKARKSTANQAEDLTSASDGDVDQQSDRQPDLKDASLKAKRTKPKAAKSQRVVSASPETDSIARGSESEDSVSQPGKLHELETTLPSEIVPASDHGSTSRNAKKSRCSTSVSAERSSIVGSTVSNSKKQDSSDSRNAKPKSAVSTDRQRTSSTWIIPPGMTEEEYSLALKDREGLTDEQRKAGNLRSQKRDKQKDSTPISRDPIPEQSTNPDKRKVKESMLQVPQSSSSQAASDDAKEHIPKLKKDVKVPSSTQGSVKEMGRKSLAATQPSRVASSATNGTPLPTKPSEPVTEPQKSKVTEQKRVKPIPVQIPELNNIKNNPPFRLQKPPPPSTVVASARAAIQPAFAPTTGTTTSATSNRPAKYMIDLRHSLNKNKSASSTPRPVLTPADMAAEAKKKKAFSLTADDEDDEESEDEDDDEDSNSDEDKENGTKSSLLHPRIATPDLESGSDISDDEEL